MALMFHLNIHVVFVEAAGYFLSDSLSTHMATFLPRTVRFIFDESCHGIATKTTAVNLLSADAPLFREYSD